MSLSEETRERIRGLIESNRVLLFMKGTRQAPQCGFSSTVVEILDGLLPEYATVDVLGDPALRDGVKGYSSWPTIPQLYVEGEFIGGCDIVSELYETGELHRRLGLEPPARVAPTLRLTPAAVQALQEAAGGADGRELHLSIDARFQHALYLAPRRPGEIETRTDAVVLLLDPASARRAEGLAIDVVQTADGPGFQIDNPNAPNAVRAMTVQELKRRLDGGERFELFDVRTPAEREKARIPGARRLDEEAVKHIESLPRDAMLVFHCHHGGRSQAAAEHFRGLGFTNLWNLVGGIDAWSREIDPTVPRY